MSAETELAMSRRLGIVCTFSELASLAVRAALTARGHAPLAQAGAW